MALIESFCLMDQTLFDDSVSLEAIRTTVSAHIEPKRLQHQLEQAQKWLTIDTQHVFPGS